MLKNLLVFGLALSSLSAVAQIPGFGVRMPMSDSVNSPQDESGLLLSPNGKTLYFIRSFYKQNVGGTAGMQDIYFSQKTADGKWTEAKNIGAPLNDEFHNAICGVNSEGTKLYLNAIKVRQDKTIPGIAISVYENNEWSFPQSLCDYAFPEKGFFQAFVAADESVALVSFEGKDSKGLEDLYVLRKNENGNFDNPVSLGETINTTGFETSPILSNDGKTLYFSSNGLGGKGDGDIFKTTRLDDSWTKWSKPENMGSSINSSGFDGSFSVDKDNIGYFISGEGQSGPGDVYMINLNPPPPPPAPPAPIVDSSLIAGNSGSANSNAENNPGGTAGQTGSKSKGADGKTGKGNNGQIPNRTDTLGQALFEFNSFVINTESKESLQNVIKRLVRNKSYRIQVEGHTDDKGPEAYNQVLSEKRAKSVKKFLVAKGIRAERIKIQGFGELNPVGDNSTDEGRAQNRRVEIKYYLKN
jgi:outer membrane protein OmpA-like peptidoglycan-associated protein